MKGREYGVIRALHALHKIAGEQPVSATDLRLIERSEQAITMIATLIDLLPPSYDLAAIMARAYARRRAEEGLTPGNRALRDAAHYIESALADCKQFSISTDTAAVEEAADVLATAAMHSPQAGIIRGDHISTNFQGAMLSRVHRNGNTWELSLRKAHPEFDVDTTMGTWLLEGGSKCTRTLIEVRFDTPMLPSNIQAVVDKHVAQLDAQCGARVHVLRPSARIAGSAA